MVKPGKQNHSLIQLINLPGDTTLTKPAGYVLGKVWPNKNTLCCYSNAFFFPSHFKVIVVTAELHTLLSINYCSNEVHIYIHRYINHRKTLLNSPVCFLSKDFNNYSFNNSNIPTAQNFTIFNANVFWQLSTVKPYLHEHLRQMLNYSFNHSLPNIPTAQKFTIFNANFFGNWVQSNLTCMITSSKCSIIQYWWYL